MSTVIYQLCPNCGHSSLFDDSVIESSGKARRNDPDSSHIAARIVTAKATTARVRLLEAHSEHPDGLTDEEACIHAGLSLQSEYASRCSELMRAGLLVDTTTFRTSSSGTDRIVRRITPAGVQVVFQRRQATG